MRERNASIDIFRIIGAIAVISIHTAPLSEYGYNWWYLTVQILPRIGVPFFFCTCGYYYIGALLNKRNIFWKTMKRFLVTYGVWSIIYCVPDIRQVLTGEASILGFILNCLRQFIIYGSREHFWFFPAVFFSIIVATAFDQIGKLHWLASGSIIAYILGLLGCSYYEIGNQIPVISMLNNLRQYDLIRRIILMGMPFFMMGYFLQRVKLDEISNKKNIVLEIFWLGIYFVEIFCVNKTKIQVNIYITITLYLLLFNTMLILLKNPWRHLKKFSSLTRDLSNFMYYSHPLFMVWINGIMLWLMERKATGTELFLLTVILSGSVGWLLHKIDNKYLNILYK